MASDYYKKLIEEINRRNPGVLPEDALENFPSSIIDEFGERFPQSDDSVIPTDPTPSTDPTAPTLDVSPGNVPDPTLPDISAENIPEPGLQTPPIPESSSFDTDISDTTPRMEGRPESLPSRHDLPGIDPVPEDALATQIAANPESLSNLHGFSKPIDSFKFTGFPKPKWEKEEDEISTPPEITPTTDPVVDSVKGPATPQDSQATEDAAILSTDTDNDQAAREAKLAALEKKRKFQAIPEVVTGIGDAISSASSAFGGNAPGGSRERMITRHDTQLAEGKENVEVQLRNDANSDISKQYQNLVAQMMQKDPSDTAILGLTANQITEKIPMIETMMQRRSDEELKKLALRAAEDKKVGADFSPAQKKFDQEMAKAMAEFTTGGGIKVAKAADASLKDTIGRFKELFSSGIDKATGKPLPLKAGKSARVGSIAPDWFRGMSQEKYLAIEQEIRANVTELLRSTLGAQFTEKEGERIFSQTFDPKLDPNTNFKRMKNLQTKLKTIADERARAVDWFNTNKTFAGYNPQSDVNWLDNEDYYNTSKWDYSKQSHRRKTKSGIDYDISDK